ncbi:hypothetical protein TeGR_g13581, partial [Tetraparma gracilis]
PPPPPRRYADSLRLSDPPSAAAAMRESAAAFKAIGDLPRSQICALDAAVIEKDKPALQAAVKATYKTSSRDVPLLRRLINKECEARMALAALLAAGGDGGGAIRERGDACERLEQLAFDKAYKVDEGETRGGGYSMDDRVGGGVECERFKKAKYLEELQWDQELREGAGKLAAL